MRITARLVAVVALALPIAPLSGQTRIITGRVADSLWDARKAVIEAGREADLGVELGRPALSEDALMKIARKRLPADTRNALRNRWSAWARERYEAIERAAKEKGSVPGFVPAPVE